MSMSKTQENIDRLAEIISNYVRTNDVGASCLAALDQLYESLHVSSDLKNWWRDCFDRAFTTAEGS